MRAQMRAQSFSIGGGKKDLPPGTGRRLQACRECGPWAC
jgi:hypothetical protein